MGLSRSCETTIDLNRLTPEEQAELIRLSEKADPPGDPPANDPPGGNPGPRQPTSEEISRSAQSDPADGLRQFGQNPTPNQPTIQRLPSPADWVNKMVAGVQAVGQTNYSYGIKHPRKDPIAEGVKAQPKYEAKMRDPAVLRRRAESLAKVTVADWAAMTESVGVQSYVQGVVGRRPKVEKAIGALQPLLANALNAIDAMPSTTDGEREAKAVAMIRALKALKGKAR